MVRYLSDRRKRESLVVVSEVQSTVGRCCLYCTPPSSSTLLGIKLWAMRMLLRSMLSLESLNQDLAVIDS